MITNSPRYGRIRWERSNRVSTSTSGGNRSDGGESVLQIVQLFSSTHQLGGGRRGS
jgi:hypothetical protein